MNKPCSKCRHAYKHPFKTKKYYPTISNEQCNACEKYKKYLEYRKSKQRYYKGSPICSIVEFVNHRSDDFMYLNDKIYTMGWIISMPYRVIENAIVGGYIYLAIKKGK